MTRSNIKPTGPREPTQTWWTSLPGLKARGKTLIVISHDEDFFSVADRVIHLSSGSFAGGAPGDSHAPGLLPPLLSS